MRKGTRVSLALLGAAIHAFADVTEGGVLGATLLLQHWCGISPAWSALALNVLCYLVGWRTLGRGFLMYSAVCGVGYSIFYALLEPFAPLWPQVAASPFWAAVLGAVFVGVGAGLCVRMGGAPGGDDALAMALSRLTGLGVQWIYLFTDALVLGLSVTYIPLSRLGWSLLTVVLSGQIIGWIQKMKSGMRNPERGI